MDYHTAPGHRNLLLTFLSINPGTTTILIFTMVLLFVISFLVSGSEVAFFSLTYKDINLLKTKRQPGYKRIVTLLETPKTLLASMIITNSLVNLGIILISNTLMESWIDNLNLHYITSFFIKVILVTTMLVMFAEVLPKVWATHHKIWFASTASLLIEIFNSIFFSLSKRLVTLTDKIENKFHPDGVSGMDNTELDYAIDLLPDHEATSEEKQILKGISKFGSTTVKQTMRTRLDVNGIEHSISFDKVLHIVQEMHYSRLPVFKNNLDEIAGILHTKDLLAHLNEPADFNWHPLIRGVLYVHEQKLIEDLLQDFRNKHMHFAIVVDEFGGTSGIVTLEDIMEEIVGDIQDEFDDESSANKKIDEYTYIFEGKTMIKDVCKALDLPVETFDKLKGDSDSLAGLLLEIAGEFPQVNEEVLCDNFIFVPLEINKNRIEKVKVNIKPQQS
ncbi:MAG: gliding motility-associated protein GldE [Ginsengibacter sp.]